MISPLKHVLSLTFFAFAFGGLSADEIVGVENVYYYNVGSMNSTSDPVWYLWNSQTQAFERASTLPPSGEGSDTVIERYPYVSDVDGNEYSLGGMLIIADWNNDNTTHWEMRSNINNRTVSVKNFTQTADSLFSLRTYEKSTGLKVISTETIDLQKGRIQLGTYNDNTFDSEGVTAAIHSLSANNIKMGEGTSMCTAAYVSASVESLYFYAIEGGSLERSNFTIVNGAQSQSSGIQKINASIGSVVLDTNADAKIKLGDYYENHDGELNSASLASITMKSAASAIMESYQETNIGGIEAFENSVLDLTLGDFIFDGTMKFHLNNYGFGNVSVCENSSLSITDESQFQILISKDFTVGVEGIDVNFIEKLGGTITGAFENLTVSYDDGSTYLGDWNIVEMKDGALVIHFSEIPEPAYFSIILGVFALVQISKRRLSN